MQVSRAARAKGARAPAQPRRSGIERQRPHQPARGCAPRGRTRSTSRGELGEPARSLRHTATQDGAGWVRYHQVGRGAGGVLAGRGPPGAAAAPRCASARTTSSPRERRDGSGTPDQARSGSSARRRARRRRSRSRCRRRRGRAAPQRCPRAGSRRGPPSRRPEPAARPGWPPRGAGQRRSVWKATARVHMVTAPSFPAPPPGGEGIDSAGEGIG